ncbi:MAG: helix-turn-helix domain-containing protein [Coriobacteriales bacterium]|nr:helix-turn-helix domain-containing protein [Coriobacteriales bacterium]
MAGVNAVGNGSIREVLFAKFGPTATPEDIAPIVHSHPSTVRRLCATGELPGVKVGKSWIIPTSRLADLLEGRDANDE